jgi:hypothetical protein
MNDAFQPAAADPADILILQTLLRRYPTAERLQEVIIMGLIDAIARTAATIVGTDELNAQDLAATLLGDWLQVRDEPGWRLARIGDCQLRTPVDAEGRALGYWQAGAGQWEADRQLQEPLRNAEWVVGLAPGLAATIAGWLHPQPWFDDLWPVERHELKQLLTATVRCALEVESPRLKGLLLLRLGYRVDFLCFYLRELSRGTPHPTPGEISQLLRHWETLRSWPPRARKLAWLALPLQLPSLHIEAVRDALRSRGLPRNAWARLHRVPMAQIRDIGLMLDTWERAGRATSFLQALGFLLSRLGSTTRFYQAWRVHLPEVLSDISSRIAAVRLGCRVPIASERQQWYRLQRRAASLRLLNVVAPGAVQPPEQIQKTELLLSAIARYLLQPVGEPGFANRQDELSELVDWFRARSAELPASAFKGEVAVLQRQARQWHQRLYEEREQRRQQEALQRAREIEILNRAAWRIPLRHHAWQGYEFLVLDRNSELIEEGLAMRHCVGGYARSCLAGYCHIVSIRCSGERIATLELRESDGGGWERAQLKGVRNALMGNYSHQGVRLRDAVRDFLAVFNHAWRTQR